MNILIEAHICSVDCYTSLVPHLILIMVQDINVSDYNVAGGLWTCRIAMGAHIDSMSDIRK